MTVNIKIIYSVSRGDLSVGNEVSKKPKYIAKPFLCVDITEDKKNEQPNGREFLVADTSAALSDALEKKVEDAEELYETSQLPFPIRIAGLICGFLGLLIVGGIVGDDGVSFAEGYNNAAWMYWLAGACILAWLITTLLSKIKSKNVLDSESYELMESGLNKISASTLAELNVPAGSAEVDIIIFRYQMKHGTPVPKQRFKDFTPFCNLFFHAYTENGNLMLANFEGKYAFSLSEFRAIRTVKKKILPPEWYKDEKISDKKYRPYKLAENDSGAVICKQYHILELEHNGEIRGIYFPCYELPVFEALTSLSAE